MLSKRNDKFNSNSFKTVSKYNFSELNKINE